jgi:hypothetical protein
MPSPDSAVRPLLSAACLVAGLLVLALGLGPPHYETNDDAVMNLIAAGRVFAATPDEHLLFSNVLLGLPLAGLYRAAPQVPWYGLYLFAVLALSLLALAYALLRANPTRRGLLLVGALLLAFALPCAVRLQFTRVAFLATLGGLLLGLSAVRGQGGRVQVVLSALLLLVACLVRFEACLLACLVLAPALAAALLRPNGRPGRLLLGAGLAAVLAAGWGLERFNRFYYERDSAWRGFYEFNSLRAQFTDYLRVDYSPATRAALRQVGWAPVDLAMLYTWSFADPERFSAAKMRAVLAAVGADDRVKDARRWRDLAHLVGGDADLLVVLAVGASCLLLLGGGWRARLVPLLCLAVAAAVCLVLFWFYHLPARVYFPALGAFAGVALLWESTRSGAAVVLVALLLGALLTWRLAATFAAGAGAGARHTQALQMLQRLAPRSDQLFVLWAHFFPYEDLVYPLEPLSVGPDFKAVSLGTTTPTPLTTRRLAEFGISDLYRALYQRRDVVLLSEPSFNRILGAYLARHYRVRLGGRVVFAHPALGGARFYTLTALPPPPRRGGRPRAAPRETQ